MNIQLDSQIEKLALNAAPLPAFSSLNLHGLKEAVALILETIGRDDIFREFTKHDISHINRLLSMLDWIVPKDTWQQMTAADCLMTTLAVYFHDMGMVVTQHEFQNRARSGFESFKKSSLGPGASEEYLEKVNGMEADVRERFLYQEFVRENHAARIRCWVLGEHNEALGVSEAIEKEVNKLLETLDDRFRKDLAFICESHHLYDLDNLDKYKIKRSYGSAPNEHTNIQYCAILLRTADLLHVTQDRAPSLSFRMLNPTDAKSIEEWHKQMAVVSVEPCDAKNSEGDVDATIQSDTIGVHGSFRDPDGFFALDKYLSYAQQELERSNKWAELARKKKASKYEFPWRGIDDSEVEALGFLDEKYEFAVDQPKILSLLTGETLYNDATVALREIVQNSLDAIRVMDEKNQGFISEGRIEVSWDRATRRLTVTDNGTGMSQSVIDSHFLKVGSSLYQDEYFKNSHPDFSPISRFGIGVLSVFMISDDIEVTTCSPEDEEARRLTLRSVHGRYLVRLLSKTDGTLPEMIRRHGTCIRIKVRSTANLVDVAEVLRDWFVFPRCHLTVSSDGGAPESIGFREPKDAVVEMMKGFGVPVHQDDATAPKANETRVVQRSRDGVTLAYAVRWSSYFSEWEFLRYTGRPNIDGRPPVALCVEGVRVEHTTPGYPDFSILAVANAVGKNAPKTNVARSGLEMNPDRDRVRQTIYDLYCAHVTSEVREYVSKRGYSVWWAIAEANYLIGQLLRLPHTLEPDGTLLRAACSKVPSLVIEDDGKRTATSVDDLAARDFFWTVQSGFFSSSETLLREIPTSSSISQLAATLSSGALKLPDGLYLSTGRTPLAAHRLAFDSREVDHIAIYQNQRRVDLRWVNRRANSPRWINALPTNPEAVRLVNETFALGGQAPGDEVASTYIGVDRIEMSGSGDETSIKSQGRTLVLYGSPYSKFLVAQLDLLEREPEIRFAIPYAIGLFLRAANFTSEEAADFARSQFAFITRNKQAFRSGEIDEAALVKACMETEFRALDPAVWARGF